MHDVAMWLRILPAPGVALGDHTFSIAQHTAAAGSELPIPLTVEDAGAPIGAIRQLRRNADGTIDGEAFFDADGLPNDGEPWYPAAQYDATSGALRAVLFTHHPVNADHQIPINRALLEPEAEAEAPKPRPRRRL